MRFLIKRQVKFILRKTHSYGAIVVAAPLIVVICTGLLLMLKKQSAWVQPPTSKGAPFNLSASFDEILAAAASVPQAKIKTWEDIDRLDVRPGKGMIKVRALNRWEVQLSSANAEILQVSYRRSDLIESIHDGSFFHTYVKYLLFFPAGLILAILWGTGMYMFFLPSLTRKLKRS